MHIFYTPDIEETNELPEDEAKHCIKVLRLKDGDPIRLTDGKKHFYEATIDAIGKKKCIVKIENKKEIKQPWSGYIHMAIAPTKNMDRNEWFAEKATEIGLNELTFLNCRYSERKTIKPERVNKILISAMKQSLKAELPKLNDMTAFKAFVEQDFKGDKYIAHCYDSILPDKKPLKEIIKKDNPALILIGPEGDFSEEEVELAVKNGFIPISLGNSRLRTETAALAACHIFNLANS